MEIKKNIEKVFSYIVTISDQSDVTLSEILEECGVTAEQYDIALGYVEKRSLYYINKNLVILKLLKSNMNVQLLKRVWHIYVGLNMQ